MFQNQLKFCHFVRNDESLRAKKLIKLLICIFLEKYSQYSKNTYYRITVLPHKDRHSCIGEDNHFHDNGFMVSIPACLYEARYAFSLIFKILFNPLLSLKYV